MRILLAYRCSREGRSSEFERLLPVGLCSLAAFLRRRGHEAALANYSGASRAEIERHLLSSRADLVGISTFTFNRSASFELTRIVRRLLPGATIVVGGPHASHLPTTILEQHPEVDFVAIGEGEHTLAELVDRMGSGRGGAGLRGLAWRADGEAASGGWPEPILDLDTLPLPFEDHEGHGVDPRTQFAILITSRGCPARCTFCNTPEFWGNRIRFRSVDHVLRELRALREDYGLLGVSFRDDTFTVSRDRILDLCRRMSEEELGFLWNCQSRVNAVDEERLVAMRRAGCSQIQYGVESGSPRMLERLAKGIRVEQIESAARATRRAGLEFSVFLITGAEGEEEEDLAATEALLKRIRPHGAVVSPLAVFPGTAVWERWGRGRGLTDAAWDEGLPEQVFARAGDARVKAAVERIGRLVSREAPRNAYGLEDIRGQRRLVGECHAVDLAEADLLERAGRDADAEIVLERLAARERRNPWGPLRLARLHLRTGRPGEAAPRLREAAELAPRNPEVHSLLGDALRHLRKRVAAEEAYGRALALEPAHAAARRGLSRLARTAAGGARP